MAEVWRDVYKRQDVKTLMYNEVVALMDGTWKDGITPLNLMNGGTNYTTEGSNVVLPDDICLLYTSRCV